MEISLENQVEFLRKDIGFNISELSDILHVSRPTVYEWQYSAFPNIQKENRIRLEEIYEVCIKWEKTNLGAIGNNLRRIMYQDKSLFDLLKEENLDRTSISEIFSLLKEIMQKTQDRKNKHEAFIKKHGLEEESKERRRIAVGLHRSIG
jgi:predicted transcriptional regulator